MESFEQYVHQSGPQLLRVAYLLTRDAHLAEDLVQSALLQVYRKWSKVALSRSIDAYVRRCLVNTYLDWTRRRSWTERPVGDELLFNTVSQVDDAGATIMRAEQLRELLTGLAPQARTIIVLRYYLDLDDATIAEHLSIAPSTVRATASRALATLRTLPRPLSMKESQ